MLLRPVRSGRTIGEPGFPGDCCIRRSSARPATRPRRDWSQPHARKQFPQPYRAIERHPRSVTSSTPRAGFASPIREARQDLVVSQLADWSPVQVLALIREMFSAIAGATKVWIGQSWPEQEPALRAKLIRAKSARDGKT